MKTKQTKEKTTKSTKKKEEHLCICCLEDTKPTELFWVSVTDHYEMSFQIPFCEKCLKNKENFSNYSSYEVVRSVHKKREYKKKVKDA
jgi:hypothetical protein